MLNSTFMSQIIFIISFNSVFSQTLLKDLFVFSLRSLNILIITVLISLSCFSSLLHILGPATIGLIAYFMVEAYDFDHSSLWCCVGI